MNKYSIFNALIKKGKESDKSLEEFVVKLEKYLKNTGQNKIWKEVLAYLNSKKKKNYAEVTITSAKHISESKISEMKKEYSDIFDGINFIEVKDENLIGGYRIDTENIRIDNTFKKQLFDLYHELSKVVN